MTRAVAEGRHLAAGGNEPENENRGSQPITGLLLYFGDGHNVAFDTIQDKILSTPEGKFSLK